MPGFPFEKHMPSYWLKGHTDLADHRTTEELPKEADVVIIGSGYSGAATAYHLLKDESSRPSTIILEAREACSGATARNGGHLKPDIYMSWPTYEKMFGPKAASEMNRFEIQQVYDVKKLVEKECIDCDFELTRAVDVFTDERVAKPTIEAYKEMLRGGFNDIDDLQFTPDAKKAEQISGVKGALAAFSFTAGHIWPYKFVSHLLRRSIQWGANLQTKTPATSISAQPDSSGRWTVSTSRGDILAKKVVVATNAYTSSLLPEFAKRITPCRGVAARIAVPDGARYAPHLNNTYCIRFGPKQYDYIICRTDGSIVVGGAKQVVLKDDSYWKNNLNDSELIPGAEEYFEGYMQRNFHGWEDSEARTTDIWTGVMGYTNDMMPYIGEMPGKKGIYLIAGFTGHGMPRILGCSEAIAGLINGSVKDMKETKVPWPYWATEERMSSDKNVAEEYMAGKKGPEKNGELLNTPKAL